MAVFPHDFWYIVNDMKTDIEAPNTAHDLKFYKWVTRGYRELNNYNLIPMTGKTVKLYLDANNAAFLPDDFIDYYKIGVCICGYMVNFDLNETLCLDRRSPCSCDEVEGTLSNCSNGSTGIQTINAPFFRTQARYLGFWEHGQYVAGVYGMGAGFYRGGYRIDYGNRMIQFDRYVQAEYVLLEYKSDGGLTENGNAFVPQILIRPLTNFGHRERCTFESENTTNKYRSQFLAGQAVKFGQRYVNGVMAAAHQLYDLTVDQWLATWRASIHQLPKR